MVLAIEEDGQEVDDRLADMHMALLLGAGKEVSLYWHVQQCNITAIVSAVNAI